MKERRLLYIVPCSGLANRMRAIASGVTLARETARVPVVIWHPDSGLNARFGDIFGTEDLPFRLIESSLLPFVTRYEIPRKKNLYISAIINGFSKRRQYVIDYDLDQDELLQMVNQTSGDVIINSPLEFYNFKDDLLGRLFRPSAQVVERINAIKDGQNPRVAVQIRRTDNAKSIAESPVEMFEKIITQRIDRDPDVKIFVATDDQNIKNLLYNKYRANIIVNPVEATRKTREGIVDAAAELFIMSEVEVVYGSYWSTFSEIASRLGRNKLVVVRKN